MISIDLIKKDALDICIKTEIFSIEEISWITSILYRLDGKNGLEQLKPLILACEKFNLEKNKLTPFQQYVMILEIQHCLYATKSLYSRQKSILIGVPQRKKHYKYSVPNLYGFANPQGIKVTIDTCYGLGYCESRNYFVEKALQKNTDYTHVFFIDDDILIPQNALSIMLNSCEPIVSANYMKRSELYESVCTSIEPDEQLIFGHKEVKAKKDDFSLVSVNAMGLGCTLIDLNVFKKLEPPYFQFIYDNLENNQKGNLILGEDTYFVHKSIANGFTPKVIVGLVPIHTNLKNGKMYAPDWVIDKETNKIKNEYIDKYCQFACNPKELYSEDIDTVFKQPTRLM